MSLPPPGTPDTFAGRLRAAMGATSARKLALTLGTSDSYIERLLGGRHPNPRIGTIEKLAEALGCSAAWLAFGQRDAA